MYEIRDPIHRTISFSDMERRVVDHPFVQRLRYVRQLGLTYLVYPGASHDRFSHALGAMHVAGRMWDRIVETSGDVLESHFSREDLAYFRQIVRFAGLLHDVGHPPFSHVSERFMPPLASLQLPRAWFTEIPERQAAHEEYSVMLIAALAEGKDAPIAPEAAQDIASLVHHLVMPSSAWQERFGSGDGGRGGIHRLLRSLISGELDCDRMDYLLRDAHFTGVAYGTHDIEHLISNLGVIDLPGKGLVRTIDSTAVRAFEDFLLARYHMFLQVYMHKTTVAFDHFLEQAIAEGEFSFDVPGDAWAYATLHDSTILEKMFAAAAKPEGRWSKRLVERHPAKMIFVSTNAKPEEKKIMDDLVATFQENKVQFFTMHGKQYLSKSHSSKGLDPAHSAMLVRRKLFGRFHFEPVEKYSSLLNKYNEAIDLTYLYVLPEHYKEAERIVDNFSQAMI